jgi:hypothetical protein
VHQSLDELARASSSAARSDAYPRRFGGCSNYCIAIAAASSGMT